MPSRGQGIGTNVGRPSVERDASDQCTFEKPYLRPKKLSRKAVVSFPPATPRMLPTRTKVQTETLFRLHHLRYCEPTGMRALAPRSWQAGGSEW